MSDAGFWLRGPAFLVDGALRPAAVHVRDGAITAVLGAADAPAGAEVVETGGIVLPGLVDAHVHVNEPGRTEWEGYAAATARALAGGVTTLVDMPLNGIPPLLDEAALATRLGAIERSARADVALWAGLVSADASALPALARAGVAGVKVFLSPSGVDEFPNVGEAELDAAMPVLRDLGLPLLAHAESPAVLERAAAALAPGADPRAHATWLATRPAEAEADAIAMLVRLCRKHRARVHVVHVSSREGCALVAAAKAEGLPVTAETCPHYLAFTADDVPEGATPFKCAPPLRAPEHREALVAALRDGTLDLVASDHSPCPTAMKRLESGDFLRAWGGIAGLEFLLPATWEALRRDGGTGALPDLARLLAEAPARLAGLAHRKGRIETGFDADFVVVRPGACRAAPAPVGTPERPSPWPGRPLFGTVEQTWLRGRLVYSRRDGFMDPPAGRFVPALRGAGRPGGH